MEGLLVAVKATNDFESDMARRFGGSGADSAADEVSTQRSWGHLNVRSIEVSTAVAHEGPLLALSKHRRAVR